MVVLRTCLVLFLVTAVFGQEQELAKIIKNLDKLVQEKKHNEVVKEQSQSTEKFSNLGKFRQAVIGSKLKYRHRPTDLPSAQPQKETTQSPVLQASKTSRQLLDRLRVFKHQKFQKVAESESSVGANGVGNEKPIQTTNAKTVEAGEVNESIDEKVVDQLLNLVTTSGNQNNSTTSRSPTSLHASPATPASPASPSPVPGTPVPNHAGLTQSIVTSQPEVTAATAAQQADLTQAIVPSPLGLTADTHQKRAGIHDLPEGDGLFLVAVLCVAVCCILGVMGVGYCVHHPACPRASSPFSDASPSFHSAQLAFSSSPEDKQGTRQGLQAGQARSSGPAETHGTHSTHTWQDARSSPASRAYKFRSGAGGGQETGRGADRRQERSVKRMESLIDIGPEEDDEDDMIYECPGLAPHGEMEVTNPFFLNKGLDSMDLEGVEVGKPELPPCPVNTNNNMRHGNIHRNIQPGQQ